MVWIIFCDLSEGGSLSHTNTQAIKTEAIRKFVKTLSKQKSDAQIYIERKYQNV
jgi:hypothetical protein